jgi:geranylgeranyl diphosphate synthase type I
VEDLGLRGGGRLDWESYLSASAGKTGALVALPVVGAALLAGRSLAAAEDIGRPFLELGVLFQLQDDVVDLYGDKGRGLVGCDVYEGKVSALVVAQVAVRPSSRKAVLAVLERPREAKTEADVAAMERLFRESGALRAVLSQIADLEQSIVDSPALGREPLLAPVAAELVRVALAPLSHLTRAEARRA